MSRQFGIKDGQRALLCASTGGHLQQLYRLKETLSIHPDPMWVTFDNSQSRSLLKSQRTSFVGYIASRDFIGVVRNIPSLWKVMRRENFDVAVSTGAAIATIALPLARLMGAEAVYIESVARFDGPSVTGKFLERVPGVRLYTQHPEWANQRWTYITSVLTQYSSAATIKPDRKLQKIFVTLGTIKPFRFDSLVDQLKKICPADANIIWQLGSTARTDLPGETHESISVERFDELVQWSDVVISHAGVGSALRILDAGKCPVMVPRSKARGEHVDDHQQQITRRLSGLELVVAADARELTYADLEEAASRCISRSEQRVTGNSRNE